MWLRLRQICLIAHKLEQVIDDLKAVFGLEICYVDPGVERFGLVNTLLPIGSQFLEVVSPFQENTAGGRYLDRREGDGGYMFITQTDELEPRRAHALGMGIRIANESKRDDFHNTQLHPKDTGGTFFEIDWNAGDEKPGGPWRPAGPNWAPAVRTDVVSAMTGAEIQSPDPEPLARRWAEIAQMELTRDDRGRPGFDLDNARLRFVEATDGRGEGLGGIDLKTLDREHVLREAEKRGCPVSGDQVIVCGTRFYLA